LLVVFRRLVVGRLPDLDREQIIGDIALVHNDVRIDRLAEMVVGRDDRSMREPQGARAKPVVIAIDLPARKLLFQMHRQPVRQRALAEIVRKQECVVRIKFLQRDDDFVQLGLHLAPWYQFVIARSASDEAIHDFPGPILWIASLRSQ
jgi:hypothetical protein